MRQVYEVLRADLLERTRSPSFLALVGITIYLTYLFVPPAEADYLTVALDNRRGIYNSAWVGAMFGLLASVLLSLVAFYIVKNAISRDRNWRVGGMLAVTPSRTATYLLGKWLSNLAVLGALLGVLSAMGLVMQLVRGEAAGIDIAALLAPIWLMGFPVMAVVAGAAIFFECTPVLRGGVGNIAYFFIWTTLLSASITAGFTEGTFVEPGNDLFGVQVPVSDMQAQVLVLDPDYPGDFSIGSSDFEEGIETFAWEGADWPPAILLGRLGWVAAGAMLALAGALPFDRFDPARYRAAEGRSAASPSRRLVAALTHPLRRLWEPVVGLLMRAIQPLARLVGSHPAGGAFLAEMRLDLGGQPWWWYAGLVALILLGLASAPETSRGEILPFAWLWPILIWSNLGVREARHFTETLVFSTPHPLLRQLPASWLAGFSVSILAASGVLARQLASGEVAAVLAILVGALFIPALAFALGAWSGTSRLFELVYLVWWYLLVNGENSLDFMGARPEAVAQGLPLLYLVLAGALLLLGLVGRIRQLRRL